MAVEPGEPFEKHGNAEPRQWHMPFRMGNRLASPERPARMVLLGKFDDDDDDDDLGEHRAAAPAGGAYRRRKIGPDVRRADRGRQADDIIKREGGGLTSVPSTARSRAFFLADAPEKAPSRRASAAGSPRCKPSRALS